MNYGKEVKKAKVKRSDHRRAKLPVLSSRRPDRDPTDFITVEREHDQLGRFGASLGTVYFDSDGDGKKDTYGKNRRVGSVRGLLEVPTFGPVEKPIDGPNGLASFVKPPISGPSFVTDGTELPLSGPSELSTLLSSTESGPYGLNSSVNAPVSGPSFLDDSTNTPSSGPEQLSSGLQSAVAGISDLSASVNPPVSGVSNFESALLAEPTPTSGPSTLTASTATPIAGPSSLTAGVESPVAGPDGLSSEIGTLNIEIVSDQTFADTAGSIDGEIKYSSDIEYLFIYDASEGVWHRTNGGNS